MATTQHHNVVQALADLADDGPAGVAATLRRDGCTGIRHESAACPVATYLSRHTDADVHVGALMWWFDPETPGTGGVLPRAVSQFIDEFDGGLHSDLDRTRNE